MIEPIVDLIRTAIVAPQGAAPIPLERRAYVDLDAAPLDADLCTVEVVPLTSTPINAQIGRGFGGVAGGAITMRHIIAVVLKVEDSERGKAATIRSNITTDLMRRSLAFDWVNANIGADQQIEKLGVTVEYADLESGDIAAWTTLAYTIDAEWTP